MKDRKFILQTSWSPTVSNFFSQSFNFHFATIKLVQEGFIRQSESTMEVFETILKVKGRGRSEQEEATEKRQQQRSGGWLKEMFEKEKFSILSKFQVMKLD